MLQFVPVDLLINRDLFWVRYDPTYPWGSLNVLHSSWANVWCIEMCALTWFPENSRAPQGPGQGRIAVARTRNCTLQLSKRFPVLYQALKPNLQNLCCWLDLLSAEIPVQDSGCNGFVTYTDIHGGLGWDRTLCELGYKTNQLTSTKEYLEENCHALEKSEASILHREFK